jgi:hypothetical protein
MRAHMLLTLLAIGFTLLVAALPATTMEEADALFAASKWEEARAAYVELLEADDANLRARFRAAAASHELGQYEDAKARYEEVARRGVTGPIVMYNLACACARLGEEGEALDYLEKAVRAGYSDPGKASSDADLATIAGEERFKALLEAMKSPAMLHKGSDGLDFLVGEWDVYSGGNKVGTNRFEKEMGGFIVREHWQSGDGKRGTSQFTFVASTGLWRQSWVDQSGWTVESDGTPGEGVFRTRGKSLFPNGNSFETRDTLTRLGENRVRQLIETSADGGETWNVGFDAVFIRQGSGEKP